MSGAKAVRPTCGNVLDIWDDMMRPFEDEEAKGDNQDIRAGVDKGDNQERESAVQEDEEKDEAISVEEEEGAMVRIGKAERAPSKEEVATHMVNNIPFSGHGASLASKGNHMAISIAVGKDRRRKSGSQ